MYGKDGGQFPPEPAEELVDFVNSVENELEIETAEQSTLEQEGLLKVIGEEIDLPYNQHLETILLDPETVKKRAEIFPSFSRRFTEPLTCR